MAKKQSNIKYWVSTLKKLDLEAKSKGNNATVGSVIDSVFDMYEHGDEKLWGLYLKLVQLPPELPVVKATHVILRDIIKYAQNQTEPGKVDKKSK